MVKLTQIDDATASKLNENNDASKSEHFSDSDSESESDFDDDFDIENETFYDRIVALKDIIPPKHRNQIASSGQTLGDYLSAGFSKGGSILWGITSSVLLLSVPLSLAILAETQLQEMEKEMSLQNSAQEVLAPGSESAFNNEKKPASA
ncbi:uncharacterized protein PRCAT00003714001 [Priceomyces carsonii]|uniref:uncharacterized protein n=1 Tax=Priceomyces carsonii TaxID=28549 RepID=UPI002ED8051B|nr:unnamed protein product [Priceomyces carsonii]